MMIEQFETDILQSLRMQPKSLPSKYFYDRHGDRIFQQIMACNDYYLYRAELEIFQNTSLLAKNLLDINEPFDIVELGAGDASKSSHLLKYLTLQDKAFTYYPIDISGHILAELKQNLGAELPTLPITCLEGDYFEMLEKVAGISQRRKILLFLGSNIGNMFPHEAVDFCRKMRHFMNVGDVALIGFDLKKNPNKILRAYNDRDGLTAKFNLNLLNRINNEIGATFNLEQFEHFQTYDPQSGACKSYVISLVDQVVKISDQSISFSKDEAIFMEVSQKFTMDDIENLAGNSNFKVMHSYFDSNRWFTDSFWIAV